MICFFYQRSSLIIFLTCTHPPLTVLRFKKLNFVKEQTGRFCMHRCNMQWIVHNVMYLHSHLQMLNVFDAYVFGTLISSLEISTMTVISGNANVCRNGDPDGEA